jgi:hypothetical protein
VKEKQDSSFFHELEMLTLVCRNLLDKQNIGDQFSVSTSMDSFDVSASHSSPNHGKVAFSPVEMQHEHDQLYLVHAAGSSAEHVNKSQDGQLLVSRETIDDGPLGEVFKGKSCQSVCKHLN